MAPGRNLRAWLHVQRVVQMVARARTCVHVHMHWCFLLGMRESSGLFWWLWLCLYYSYILTFKLFHARMVARAACMVARAAGRVHVRRPGCGVSEP